MPSVSFGTFSKRINSTKRPGGLGDTRNVKLKDTTSVDHPTFILTGNDFNYNYAKWDDRYYFISDIRSRHDNLIEIDCELDVLATYKDYILGSTQYVSYSNVSGGQWLSDTRIAAMKNTITHVDSIGIGGLSKQGTYVLSVVGKDSAACYDVTQQNIKDILYMIDTWQNDGIQSAQQLIQVASSNDNDAICQTLATIGSAMINTGFVGNAYSQAPQCIRSCHWVPMSGPHSGSEMIWLGNFNTHVMGRRLIMKPVSDTYSIAIPWHYNDWRRGVYEDVYLYLPLVGTVQLSASSLTHVNSLGVKYSLSVFDGNISYQITAGGDVVGVYGGSCLMQVPIGINQATSAGEIFNSFLNGMEKTLDAGIKSTISPLSAAAATAGMYYQGARASYDTINTIYSTHASCIGGVGGGVGGELSLDAQCFTVCHPTNIEPAQMAATMGVPTMKPLQLSACSGYCQCANAHVDAPAMAHELDVIDQYLNGGFYIE